jgi:hypothetical protein
VVFGPWGNVLPGGYGVVPEAWWSLWLPCLSDKLSAIAAWNPGSFSPLWLG